MSLQQLWFIRYDSMVLTGSASLEALAKLGSLGHHQLIPSGDSDVQLQAHQLLRLLDEFMEVERITTLYLMQAETCTPDELEQAERTMTKIYQCMELEKHYANQLWIGRKLDWNVEMRILASLCRLFLLLVAIHAFLVGQFTTLWNRSKLKRLIVPLERTERFVNGVFGCLRGIEEFYYRYEYPYIRDIHQLLEAYRKLLTGFHKLPKEELPIFMTVFEVVLAENKKYARIVTERNIRTSNIQPKGTNKRKLRNRERSESAGHTSEIDFALEYGYRKRRTHSQKEPKKAEEAKKSNTDFIVINLKGRQKTHWTSTMRSNTEYTSTRELIDSRPHIKESITSRQMDTSENKSRLSSRKKVVSRRTLAPVKSKTREVIKESEEQKKVEFRYDSLVEKETNFNQINSFYKSIKDTRKDQPQIKVSAVNRQDSNTRRMLKASQMVSGKFEYIRQRVAAVINSNQAVKVSSVSGSRSNCY